MRAGRPFPLLRIILTAAIFALSSGASGPLRAQAQEIVLPSDLAVGEAHHYAIHSTVEVNAQGVAVLISSWRARLTVTVLERDERGLLVAWRYDRASLDDALPQIRTSMKQVVAGLDGLELRLRVGPDMAVEKIENMSRVGDVFRQTADIMAQRLEYFGQPAEAVERYRAAYNAPEVVSLQALRDPKVFFTLIGRSLPRSESFTYAGQIPNPLDFTLLPSRGLIEVQRLDAARDLAWIVWNERIDQEKASDALLASLKRHYEAFDEPLPATPDLPRVETVESAFAEIDSASGWPVAIDFESHVQFAQGTTVNRVEIGRLPN